MQPDAGWAEWLQFARADIAFAQNAVEGPRDAVRDLRCFHAQQAAERAIKAVLVHRGITFPWIHSIEALLALLPETPSPEVAQASVLTDFATLGRYPGTEHATDDDLAEAIELARTVLTWAESTIHPADHPESPAD